MNVTDTSRLTESPGPMLVKNGARYHDGEQIISHLNYSLGPAGWDWEEMERGYDEMADQVWVRGKLTARFVSDGPDGYATTEATKIECGWNEVKRSKNDRTKLVDLGSDYKGADTDALKRAARLFGVGLDAWEKGGPAPRQHPRANQAPACDKERWNKHWHAVVAGTRFEDDDTRHKFVKWYSRGELESLSAWLDLATDEQAERLIESVAAVIERERQQGAAS